jgi:hypothetical protein
VTYRKNLKESRRRRAQHQCPKHKSNGTKQENKKRKIRSEILEINDHDTAVGSSLKLMIMTLQ